MARWAGATNTTLQEFIYKQVPAIMRNQPITALMMKKGRVKYNKSGLGPEWPVRWRRHELVSRTDMAPVNYSRLDDFKRARLDNREYVTTTAFSELDRLENRGKEALARKIEEIADIVVKDATEQFAVEFYNDGNATGNNGIHGLESFLGNSGAAAGGFIGTPSDTYAGISTELGTYDGTWSASPAWPDGSGSYSYDFWSPIIVDYTDASWTATTDMWPNTCLEALRYGINRVKRNSGGNNGLDVILLDGQMYRQLLDKYDPYQQININRGPDQSLLVSLGFKDTVYFDGVEITWSYGLPVSNSAPVGYGLHLNSMELCCLTKKVFEAKGPSWDEYQYAWNVGAYFAGNLKVETPRNFVKFAKVT